MFYWEGNEKILLMCSTKKWSRWISAGRNFLEILTDCHNPQRLMEIKHVFARGCILTRTKCYWDVNVTIHEMFSFVRMFSRIRNGWHLYHPVDMLQSKQVRLLVRNKIKRWTCVIYLCHMPMRTVVFSSAHLQPGLLFHRWGRLLLDKEWNPRFSAQSAVYNFRF